MEVILRGKRHSRTSTDSYCDPHNVGSPLHHVETLTLRPHLQIETTVGRAHPEARTLADFRRRPGPTRPSRAQNIPGPLWGCCRRWSVRTTTSRCVARQLRQQPGPHPHSVDLALVRPYFSSIETMEPRHGTSGRMEAMKLRSMNKKAGDWGFCVEIP